MPVSVDTLLRHRRKKEEEIALPDFLQLVRQLQGDVTPEHFVELLAQGAQGPSAGAGAVPPAPPPPNPDLKKRQQTLERLNRARALISGGGGKLPMLRNMQAQQQELIARTQKAAEVPQALTRGLPVLAQNLQARELAATPGGPSLGQRQVAGIPGTREEAIPPATRAGAGPVRANPLADVAGQVAGAVGAVLEPSLKVVGKELENFRFEIVRPAAATLWSVLSHPPTSEGGLLRPGLLDDPQKLEEYDNLPTKAKFALELIADPTNVLPGVGFGPDVLKLISKVAGKTVTREGLLAARDAVRPLAEKAATATREGLLHGEAGMVGKRSAEDLAAEAAERATRAKYRAGVPTIRDIEARTTPIPPEARAAMRPTAPEGPQRLLTFEEAQAIRGGQYETNWVTKLSDFVSGAIPALRSPLARTPADKATRSVMTARDWYIMTQGAKATNRVWEWMDRARKTLGLDLRTGRLRTVRLKPEFANDAPWFKDLQGYVNHVARHPEKYFLTPEQLALIEELQGGGRAPLGEILTLEQRAGIDISEIENYFPTFAKKTPPGYKVSEGRGTRLGTRPSHAKHRVFGDVEARYEAGFRDDPIAALFGRAQAGIEAIANAEAVKRIKAMGFKPSDVLQATHAGEVLAAKEAREAYKAARAAAVRKGAGIEEKAAVEIADAHLEDSVRALKSAAAQVREKGPRLFGRIVSYEVRDAFAKYTKNLSEGFVDDVFSVMRGTAISGDLSAGLIQNWYTFFRNPPAWGLAMAEGVHGLYEEPLGYLGRNYESIMRGLDVAALRAPTEFLLRQGGGMSRWLHSVPGVKQTQRAFEWQIFIAQSERWKAVERLARTPDEMMEMAAVLRKQSGILIMPGMTATQVKVASRVVFAPQFAGAIHSAVFDIFRGGAAGREAMKSVSMAFGGAAALTTAINYKLNDELPNMTDPDLPGFWGIKVGDGYVFPFGPYQPAIVALARTGRAIDDARQGKMPGDRDLQAIPRLLESKAGVPARTLIAVGDALGMPFDKLRGEPFENLRLRTPGDWRRFFSNYLPIGLSQAKEGIDRGFPPALFEVIGGRTSPMPTWGGIDLEVKAMPFVDSAGNPIEHYRDLTELQKFEAEQNPKIKAYLARAEGQDDTSRFYAVLEEDRADGLNDALDQLALSGLNHEALAIYNGTVEQVKTFQSNAFRFMDMTGLLEDARETTNPDLALYRDFQSYTAGAAGPGGTWDGEKWGQLADGFRKLIGEDDWKTIIVPQMMVDRNPQVQRLQTWAIEVGETGYYDLNKQDGSADRAARDRMRQADPELDAKLFLLGGPSRVMTPQAKALVEKWFEELLAGKPTTAGSAP